MIVQLFVSGSSNPAVAPVVIANHTIVAVMFPWLTMWAKPTEASFRTVRTADSYGLN